MKKFKTTAGGDCIYARMHRSCT